MLATGLMGATGLLTVLVITAKMVGTVQHTSEIIMEATIAMAQTTRTIAIIAMVVMVATTATKVIRPITAIALT